MQQAWCTVRVKGQCWQANDDRWMVDDGWLLADVDRRMIQLWLVVTLWELLDDGRWMVNGAC